jgi:hypothetical protein
MSHASRIALSLAFIGLAGCGAQELTPPPFEAGEPVAEAQAPYPGPYGISTGSVIYNYQFLGLPRASYREAIDLQSMQLADFYNPSGEELFVAGSPYGEGPKPKALALIGGVVWCGPSNVQASTEIPKLQARFGSRAQFFFVLEQGPTREPATQQDLVNWSAKYKVDYPLGLDPRNSLGALIPEDAWPANIIIRTKDMKIIGSSVGIDQDAFWQLFQDVIDDKPVTPKFP